MTEPPKKGERPERASAERALREIDVRDLIGQGREVAILHDGERYRLRLTANNKLILTK